MLWNQFSTPVSSQTENVSIAPIGPIGAFSVGPLPKVENLFRKQILNEKVHTSI